MKVCYTQPFTLVLSTLHTSSSYPTRGKHADTEAKSMRRTRRWLLRPETASPFSGYI